MFSLDDYSRYLSWKNFFKAAVLVCIIRIGYTLFSVYVLGHPFGWYEDIYPIIMDIVAPGAMELQYMLEAGVRALPSPVESPIGYTLSLMSLIISIQIVANPMFRDLIRDWLIKKHP
jgi:hypothetical protein